MNNLLRFSYVFCVLVSCTKTTPIEEPEQTLFENISSCNSLHSYDFNDPGIKKLYSDSITIINATGIKTDSGHNIMRIDIKNNKIDPKRFPGWGNGNVSLFPCNMPEKLQNTGKYQNVIFDFRLFYFIPLPGTDYSGYPVELLRVQVLPD